MVLGESAEKETEEGQEDKGQERLPEGIIHIIGEDEICGDPPKTMTTRWAKRERVWPEARAAEKKRNRDKP